MSVYQNINGTLARMDASDLVQLAAVDTEGILGGAPGATTNGQTLVDQLAADDVQAQTDIGQIRTDLSDYHVVPSKNLMPNDSVSKSESNLKCTVNADGSIDFDTNGQTTSAVVQFWVARDFYLDAGSYILDAGVAIPTNIYWSILTPGNHWVDITGGDSHASFTLTERTLISQARLYVASGQTVSHLLLKPMIKTAADYAADPSYEPYYVCMRDGKFDVTANTVLGAHNLLPNFAVAETKNGITLAIDSDGVITVNGTLTSGSTYFLLNNYSTYGDLPIPSGKYRGSGAPKTYTGTATVVLNFYNFNGNSADNYERGDGIALDYVRGSNFNVAIIVSGGVGKTVTNAKFYPMLTDIRDTDRTYAPYAMTNRELTDMSTVIPVADSEFSVLATGVSISNNWSCRYGKLLNISLTIAFSSAINAFTNILEMPNYYLGNGKTGTTAMTICAKTGTGSQVPIAFDVPAGAGSIKIRNSSNISVNETIIITGMVIIK